MALDTLDRQRIVDSAKEAFAESGYPGTTLDAVAERTGVDSAGVRELFGTERDLFEAALADYAETFIAPRLGPMEAPGAGTDSVLDFFSGLAAHFADGPNAQHGCLVVNTVGDLAGRDKIGDTWGTIFQQAQTAAFANALGASTDRSEAVDGRVQMLVAQTLGVWLLVRIDREAAAQAARTAAEQVAAW